MKQQQKNLMTSRAQTTSEFLIILAIVLIILVIFSSQLVTFPSFSNTQLERMQTTFWTNADIAVIGADSSGEEVRIFFKNLLFETITIDSVVINDVIESSSGLPDTLLSNDIIEVFFDNITIIQSISIFYTNEGNSKSYVLEGPGFPLLIS